MQGACGKDAFVECERKVKYKGIESTEGELAYKKDGGLLVVPFRGLRKWVWCLFECSSLTDPTTGAFVVPFRVLS